MCKLHIFVGMDKYNIDIIHTYYLYCCCIDNSCARGTKSYFYRSVLL